MTTMDCYTLITTNDIYLTEQQKIEKYKIIGGLVEIELHFDVLGDIVGYESSLEYQPLLDALDHIYN